MRSLLRSEDPNQAMVLAEIFGHFPDTYLDRRFDEIEVEAPGVA